MERSTKPRQNNRVEQEPTVSKNLMTIEEADADLRKNNPLYQRVCKTLEECASAKSIYSEQEEKNWSLPYSDLT